jgi:hypothetical protein
MKEQEIHTIVQNVMILDLRIVNVKKVMLEIIVKNASNIVNAIVVLKHGNLYNY